MNDLNDIKLVAGDIHLSKPSFIDGKYDNPWSTWKIPSFMDVLRWKLFGTDHTNLPKDVKELDQKLPVHAISDEEIKKFCSEDTTNKTKVIWIGHATSLVNFQNNIILMDPVFSERCSPFRFIGPQRFRPVPITIDRIPHIDAVVISHNHFDHLDHQSVKDLNDKVNSKTGDKSVNWFVGKGTSEWFRSIGVKDAQVHELSWWESKKFNNLEFVFTPAQHWCRRTAFDTNKALWGSWTVLGPKKRFFFAGDTGYCSAFTEIGKKYGPFDLSFIPIGAYEPRWFMSPQHVDPEQAVLIHQDVSSRKSIGIHWATFALAYEFYLEPRDKLKEALNKKELEESSFITVKHGETYDF